MSGSNVDDLIQELESLRIQEQDILRRLVTSRTLERNRVPENQPNSNTTTSFRIGDRVQITNNVRASFGQPPNDKDRLCVVTKITAQRVYIRTRNGLSTWRLPTNLRFIDN
jgi:hypothetical protein